MTCKAKKRWMFLKPLYLLKELARALSENEAAHAKLSTSIDRNGFKIRADREMKKLERRVG